jgi:NAD(P)-dependent dehydrogenase (short-subunit alcohol dehydrogenase family)
MMKSNSDMSGKTVLVTGASQGIGKVVARELARQGARLVLVCRSRERAESAVEQLKVDTGAADIDLILADLASMREVRRAAEVFAQRYETLDVLLNNAGVLATSRRVSDDGYEHTFATNHLSAFLLTKLLLPFLERSGAGRVVTVASDAHRFGRMHFDDPQLERRFGAVRAYCQSKLGNVLFTYELARRLPRGTRVTANCLHPGICSSNFGKTDGGLMAMFMKAVGPFLASPEQAASTSIYLCSSPDVREVTGKYFCKCRDTRSSPESYDPAQAQRLWALSEELTAAFN